MWWLIGPALVGIGTLVVKGWSAASLQEEHEKQERARRRARTTVRRQAEMAAENVRQHRRHRAESIDKTMNDPRVCKDARDALGRLREGLV
jgi:FtsZ-interacting cell division protein YlmF